MKTPSECGMVLLVTKCEGEFMAISMVDHIPRDRVKARFYGVGQKQRGASE